MTFWIGPNFVSCYATAQWVLEGRKSFCIGTSLFVILLPNVALRVDRNISISKWRWIKKRRPETGNFISGLAAIFVNAGLSKIDFPCRHFFGNTKVGVKIFWHDGVKSPSSEHFSFPSYTFVCWNDNTHQTKKKCAALCFSNTTKSHNPLYFCVCIQWSWRKKTWEKENKGFVPFCFGPNS